MPLFDSYLMVDWSASSRPRTGKDSVWWAFRDRSGTEQVKNPPTREAAREDIVGLLRTASAEGRHVLVGFDFPFGLPRGAATVIAGKPRWDALWKKLNELIEDRPDNSNNRFQVASDLNVRFDRRGPFWGRPQSPEYPALFMTRPIWRDGYPPRRRHTEDLIKTAKTVWQLFGAGTVGGQGLLGIPYLQKLRAHPALRSLISVWPFEAFHPDRPIVLAEIYPSLLPIPRQPGEVFDRTQVVSLARYFADWDGAGNLADAFEMPDITEPARRNDVHAEEGCILGVGCTLPPLTRKSPEQTYSYIRDPAGITRRSFAIISSETKSANLPADIRSVAERIVHASGMPDVIADLDFSMGASAAGRAALRGGAPIICDARMVAAGLTTRRVSGVNRVHVALDERRSATLAARTGQTRSAAGMELAAKRLKGAIVVIGNAPTALFRLLELVAAGAERPALVLGFPVGFVGAAESKAALAASGLPFITLHGRRGGSAMAAAALNALILDGN